MKILHIWDVAGVAYVLAKYQRKDGHHVKVYMRKIFDLFEIGKFYDEPQITCGAFRFIINSIFMARHYDIIHVHSIWKTVPLIKILFRKKIILHYHGTSTKHKLLDRRNFSADCCCVYKLHIIICSKSAGSQILQMLLLCLHQIYYSILRSSVSICAL